MVCVFFFKYNAHHSTRAETNTSTAHRLRRSRTKPTLADCGVRAQRPYSQTVTVTHKSLHSPDSQPETLKTAGGSAMNGPSGCVDKVRRRPLVLLLLSSFSCCCYGGINIVRLMCGGVGPFLRGIAGYDDEL